MNPLDWLDYEVFGNSLLIWAAGFGVFILVWTLLVFVRRILRSRLTALALRRDIPALTTAEYVVGKTRSWFLMLTAFYAGSRIWTLPDGIQAQLDRGITIVVLVQAGLWATAALGRILDIKRKHELEDNPGIVAAMDLLGFVARVGVWSLVLIFMLDNLGVNITTLVAGLGVGGIAVALAAQNILGDLFASLSIVLDKPFVVGDFLNIDGHLGTVEKVGIKTTRVRSLSGEQLIFSNNDLLGSRIRNYGRMYERRVVFSIGVTYQTPAAKLARISEMLKTAVEAQKGVRFDRAHFQQYGDSALIYEVVYYVLSPEYNAYMDIQQAINILIFERFAEEGLEFAYPTHTIHLAGGT
jgi:small-conductance mechanosensitive channel